MVAGIRDHGNRAYNKAGHTAHFVRWTRYTAFRSPVPAALCGNSVPMKSGSKGTDRELKKFSNMSLEDINREIDRCLWGSRNGGTTAGRKAFFKRLLWLEKIREEQHGIEAPGRDFRKH